MSLIYGCGNEDTRHLNNVFMYFCGGTLEELISHKFSRWPYNTVLEAPFNLQIEQGWCLSTESGGFSSQEHKLPKPHIGFR